MIKRKKWADTGWHRTRTKIIYHDFMTYICVWRAFWHIQAHESLIIPWEWYTTTVPYETSHPKMIGNVLLRYSNTCSDDRNRPILAYTAENKKLLWWRTYASWIRMYLEGKLWWHTLINSNHHIRYTCTIVIIFFKSVNYFYQVNFLYVRSTL